MLHHFALLPMDDIEELEHLSRQTAAAAQSMEAEAVAEAEAPEEFMDPILSDIMVDPVTLPSGMNVDLQTIKHHMMTESTDPFTRCSSRLLMVMGAWMIIYAAAWVVCRNLLCGNKAWENGV